MQTIPCSTDKLDGAIKQLEKRKEELEEQIDERRQKIEALGTKTQAEYIAFVASTDLTKQEGDKAMEIINGCILVLRELRKNPALDLRKFNITGCSQQRELKCLK